MEIADIFVVNKADRGGVDQTIAELESLIDILCANEDRRTPILATTAKQSKGISELAKEIKKHKEYLEKNNLFEMCRRKRYEAELVEIIKRRLMHFIFDESTFKSTIESQLDQIVKQKLDPYTAAEEILGKILK
jgi:LAO/AO transport system kinase